MRKLCKLTRKIWHACRVHVAKFLDNADTACLWLHAEGKDLVAVRLLAPARPSVLQLKAERLTFWYGHSLPQALKPPSEVKRKAVYFAKLAKTALTAESVATSVRPALQHSRASSHSRRSAAVTPAALSAAALAGRLWRAGRGAAGGAGHAKRRGRAAAAVQPGHAGRPPRAGGARRGGLAAEARQHERAPGSHPGWVHE